VKISQGSRLQFAGGLAKLREKLDAGQVPEDLVLVQGATALPLHPEVAERQGGRQYWSRVVPMAGVMAMGGAALGMLAGSSLTPLLPTSSLALPILAGTAVGVGVGAVVGWDQGKDLRGTVGVELDGRSEKQSWKGDAQLRARTSAELNVMLTALGELGDNIPPAAVSLQGAADPQVLQHLKDHKDQLLQLAEQRRLVADLGSLSRYGKSALQLVDANAARELAARGKPVFVVEGEKTTDQPHHLRTTAYTGTRNQVIVDDYQYVDRKFDYRLTPLSALGWVQAEAGGVPEGLLGVYAQGGSYTQAIERHCEQGQRVFLEQGQEMRRHSLETASRVQESQVAPSGVPQVLANLTRNSTKASTIAGSILGGCAAGLLGVEPTAGLIAGGVAGHLLGRVSIGSEPGSPALKVSRGLMMAAGAAGGVGLAVHGGMHASLAVGAVGGLLTGVLAGSKVSPQHVRSIAEGAFVGGSLLGIAAGISGAPWATLPLVVLGGVGGGMLGRVAL
jgi:hypothetical protein